MQGDASTWVGSEQNGKKYVALLITAWSYAIAEIESRLKLWQLYKINGAKFL